MPAQPAGGPGGGGGGVRYDAPGTGSLPRGAKLKRALLTRRPVVKFEGHKYKGSAAIEKRFGVRIE